MNRKWVAFFSQTGSEIVEVSKLLGRWPDLIIANERPDHLRKIHPALENKHLIFVDNKPSEEELFPLLAQYDNALITLHGWLRIMPADICNRFEIYNGHPGLITEKMQGGYGDLLVGKDPQEKAYKLNLPYSGCVIHKVVEGVDEGEILSYRKVSIENLELAQVFQILHSISVSLWVEFLKTKIS
jgi:folate-dependent phosphoribosylglycinamide formyltransferase PurN